MIVAFCHSAAVIATLGAVAHAVITTLMGEEITVLVADAASQTHLKAHCKVSGWTSPIRSLKTSGLPFVTCYFSYIIIPQFYQNAKHQFINSEVIIAVVSES